MVEDLDQLVVRARFRQELRGGGEGLARPRGRTEPRLRIRLEQHGHHLPQRLRDALGRTGRPVLGEILDERLAVRLGPLQQIQRDQPYGEQVGGKVRFGAHHLLGCEITGRPDDEVGLRQAGLAQPHRDAEVGQPQPRPARAGGLQQHVGRFDVTVHDVLRVHRGQARQQLVEQGADKCRREGAVVPDEMGQGAARDQIHGEQDLVVVGGPAGRGEYMGMVDPQGLFPDEAQQRVRVALEQDLGGHVASAAVVPGAPDGAHPSASDRVDQFVPAGEDLTHGCTSLLPLWLPPCFPLGERYDSPTGETAP